MLILSGSDTLRGLRPWIIFNTSSRGIKSGRDFNVVADIV